jgi:hypothetical protein
MTNPLSPLDEQFYIIANKGFVKSKKIKNITPKKFDDFVTEVEQTLSIDVDVAKLKHDLDKENK